ncbi:MAG: ketoacyl-ACP synthase III, partial [Bacteroidales bacterium]|nr:ketoacyl-ACP synthase III [Bacteroidales bacterium]
MSSIYSVITGTGSYIPTRRIKNEDFLNNEFYDATGKKIDKNNQEIIDKFLEITTIKERRYVTDDLVCSDMAYFAAVEAIKSANINKEELDYIIVAHNFGDVKPDDKGVDIVPSLAARVKYKLEINNPGTVAYDIPFGCPGWLQGIIQADYYIKSGDAKKILVIGADTLSRISDPHDRDSMLYADGAGATVIEAKESDTPIGILAHKSRSDTLLYSNML